MKSKLAPVLKLICVLLAAIASGFVLITAVYLLPAGPIKANAEKSAEIFRIESNYPKLIQYHFNTTLDNWTDATIIAEAAYDGERGLLERAMLNPHLEVENENQAESFVKLYGGGDEPGVRDQDYGRYWHGYLLFVKPLMTVMDYGMLRELMGFAELAMTAALIWLLSRRGRTELIIPVVLIYAFMNPAALSMTINYAVMFFVVFTEMLLIVSHSGYSDRGKWCLHFLLVGCAAAFFDYLTYPLASFGVPMLLLLSLYPESPKADFISTVKSGLSWILGYAGMWASKWVLGSLISGVNILRDAGNTLAMRSGGDVGEEFSRIGLALHAIYKNLTASKLVLALAALFLIGCIVYACAKRIKPDIGRTLLICAFMATPLAWYAFAANHSYLHYFFTYRTLSISVFGAALLGLELINCEPVAESDIFTLIE